jgi:GntR family transcriptional regulator, transcriptional repressor for pyruvate dehydrogenase complex
MTVEAPVAQADVLLQSLARAGQGDALQTQIRRHIVENNLRPGDRLPSEGELSTILGNSRLIVREALRALEAVGLVESRAGSGWYVRPFDVSAAARIFAQSLGFHQRALLDLLAVRRSAEADLVGSLAGTLGERDLAALDELADRMRWRASRRQAFPAEDGEFHRRLLACSGNMVALALVDLYFKVVEEMYQRGLPKPAEDELMCAADAHVAIAAALRHGNGAAAAHQMRAHHDYAESRIGEWIAAHESTSSGGAARAALQAALLWPGPGASG